MSKTAEIFESMEYGPAPEDSSYVFDWIRNKRGGFQHFINGEFTSGKSKSKPIESFNPATGEKLTEFPAAGKVDVDAAVDAAKAAYPAWSGLSGHSRARYLYALARLVQKNSRFLAVLESIDNGKPIRETRDIDIPLVARHFYHHAGWAQLMEEEFPDHEPLGVVGQIIPWNFPLLMLSWKIAPAIAAGNTVVLKPAEFTSLTALYFAELCKEAQLPPGVVNIVTGAGETGALIVEHPDVSKIAFTGSTDVGRIIRQQTAGSGKKLSLELGGKSPFIIFEDADLDGAVEGLVDAIWFNQGQVCCAGSRLLVEESVAERVTEKIKRRLQSFRVGDPLDKAIDMGAIVDPTQRERIQSLVEQGGREGGDVWSPDITMPSKGCFYPPTLISNVSPSNVAVREEIFGPVLVSMTFRTLKEALELANNTRYGLAATIWSENINRALEAASQVKAGVVWINTTNGFDHAINNNKITVFGGKQKRPDWARTIPVAAHDGKYAGRVALGNRKDIRDAVEAAFNAASWGTTTGHARAQILYFLAENFSKRADEFARRLTQLTGATKAKARAEVEATISRLFSYGAWADKYDGLAHSPPQRNVVLAVNEPIGIVGVVCPDTAPLLSFVSLWAPAVAMGNRVVIVPSERYGLLATDFYQILETSDVPGGVINIVTGERATLTKTLAEHDQVEAIWHHGPADESAFVEKVSASNLKRVWTNNGRARDWKTAHTGEGREFLRHATEVKNIWLPYGD